MLRLSKQDQKQYAELLKPSWLSMLLAVVAGLFVTIGVIVAFQFNNSGVQQQLLAWQTNKPQRALTTPDQTLAENDHPTLKGSWPLILVWSVVGLAVYFVTISIVESLGRAQELSRSLNYVHANRQAELATTAEHVVVRMVSTLIFLSLFWLLIKQVVPYSITAAHAAAVDVASVNSFAYALLAFLAIAVTIHLQAIFLRLSFGRVRVFTS